MTQADDLTAAVAANTAATAALKTAAESQIADTRRLLDLLAQGPQPDPAVAQAIADVQASTAQLEGIGTELAADDASMPPTT